MIYELYYKGRGLGVPVLEKDLDSVINILRRHPQYVKEGREIVLPKIHGWIDVQLCIDSPKRVIRPLGRRFLRMEEVPF